ncbi:MAG: hypothetical protein HKN07_04290 [Acidimicrobiia bacterium]|nr:hypothetical protein [Acidimicrobiia bacterium]NNF63458.1 hypothetical protein [Acidimicrobiia bacterium]
MSTNLLHYLPIASTIVAAAFAYVLYRHWQKNTSARYVMWWMIGIGLYGLGTLTEALTTLFGWNEPVFRTWYVAGALLGGAPLAQGTVYLLLKRKTADRLAVAIVTYIAMASAFVIATPLELDLVETNRLSGEVMAWQWVRLFSPVVNLYAVVFLIGGAFWSAWKYRKTSGARSRVVGNVLIAVGAILPGIGGGFARAGTVEVLYVAELLGLALIWAGYRQMTVDRAESIHEVQRMSTAPTFSTTTT